MSCEGNTIEDEGLVVSLNEKIKLKILSEFDAVLISNFGNDLCSFLETIEQTCECSFHETVDIIFDRDGPNRLREFLNQLIEIIEDKGD